MIDDKGLKSRLKDEIIEELKEEANQKKGLRFKMKNPLERKMKLNYQKVKKGWCIVVIIRANGALDIKKLPTENGMVKIPGNETYHIATAEYIMRFGKYPVILLPEWSVEPISPDLLVAIANQRKTNVDAEAFMMWASEYGQIMKKKDSSGTGKIILWVLGAVAIGYVIMQFINPTKK